MNAELDRLVSDIDEYYSIVEYYPMFIKFFLECLELVQEHIPPSAIDCFRIAKEAWQGEMNEGALERERVKCWEILDDIERNNSGTEKAAFAIRALICVLYPKPSAEDTHELLYWFVSLVGRVSEVDRSIISIANAYFPEID